MPASSARTPPATRSIRTQSDHAGAIRPIRSAADHRAALAEIATLMPARPGTPDGDRLDILTTLVEAWEARHTPIEAPTRSPPSGS